MIHVGFTGTRHGMTEAQKSAVFNLVSDLAHVDNLTTHHGDCIGADAEFHNISCLLATRLVVHPPVDESHRAFVKDAHEWRAACTHFARNRAIVLESTVMIATPYEAKRQMRGGTWYTISRAMLSGKPLALVLPTGGVVYDGGAWPRPVWKRT